MLRIGRTSAYLLTQRWRHSGGESGLPVQRLGRLLRVPRSAIERMKVRHPRKTADQVELERLRRQNKRLEG